MISKRHLTAIAVLLAPIGALAAILQAADAPPTELYVRTAPAGATAVLDGKKLVGKTPRVFEVAPGRHELVVYLEGHKSITQEIEVPASEIKRVILPLEPIAHSTTADDNAALEEERWHQRLETLLAKPGNSVNYEDITVSHMLESLARNASSVEGAEVKIVVDRRSLAEAGISLAILDKEIKLRLKNATLGTVLHRALSPFGLGYEIRDGRIVVRALKVRPVDDAPKGRLDLRVAATRHDEGGDQKAISELIADLKANGPEPGRGRGEPFAWFPWDDEPRPELITAEHEGRTFVLLANTPEHTMLAGSEPAWSVSSVTVHRELHGRPAVGVELDEAGGHRFGKLTEAHLRRPIAILVDDRVISAPIVQSRITTRVQITGNFDVEEAERLAGAIMSGMRRSKPADEMPSDTPGVGKPVLPVFHDVTKNEFRWPISANPGARLAHGLVSFDTKDGQIAIREHMGAGSSGSPLDEPVELIVRSRRENELLGVMMAKRWKEKTAEVTAKTAWPKDATLQVEAPMSVTEPTTDYQVFWRGDFFKAGRVVKSVAYVVRLSPLAENYDGFGKEEMPQVTAAIRKAEGADGPPTTHGEADRILRRYSEAVSAELPAKLRGAERGDIEKICATVAADLTTRCLMPHADLLAADALGRLPKAEPVDMSQWAEIPLKSEARKIRELSGGYRMMAWNPVTLVNIVRLSIVARALGAQAVGRRSVLETAAPIQMVVWDASLEKPVIAVPMGDELFVARLERGVDRLYAFRGFQWLRRNSGKSAARPTPSALPADASFQQRMRVYSDAVWTELLPKVNSLEPEQIQQECCRLAEEHFKGHEGLFKQEAERVLAELPKAPPVDRSRWVSRLSESDKKAIDSCRADMKKVGYSSDNWLFVWNPLQVARAARNQCIHNIAGSGALRDRSLIVGAVGRSLEAVVANDPSHPAIVQRIGDEFTIVHLRRTPRGAYELDDFEWLVPADHQADEDNPDGSDTQAIDKEKADRILRGYAEAVVAELAGKLGTGEPGELNDVMQDVTCKLTAEHLMPHADLLAAHVLGRLPLLEPIDLSDWEELALGADARKIKDLGEAPGMIAWNPVAMAYVLRKIVLTRQLGVKAYGNRAFIEGVARSGIVLWDRSIETPVIVTPMGSELFVVRLERGPDDRYTCRDLRWYRRKPAVGKAGPIRTMLPADASAYQQRMRAYSNEVWSSLLPRVDSLDIEQIGQEVGRLAKKHFNGHEDLLKQEAERILADLPRAEPVDRSRWVSRLSADQKKELQSAREGMKGIVYWDSYWPYAWDPAQAARAARTQCLAVVEGLMALGIRGMILNAAGRSLDTVADADPDRPVFVERIGIAITIVRLRRTPLGTYELDDFELLMPADADEAEPMGLPRTVLPTKSGSTRPVELHRDGAVPNKAPKLREYTGPWGRIEAGFVPDATRVVVGQPLFIDFVVRNSGTEPLVFQMGGDNRGSVRHNRFMIVARIGDGNEPPLTDPHDYQHGGGALRLHRLGPGETYRQPLLLQHWVSLEAAWQQIAPRLPYGQQQTGTGRLSISAAHTLAIGRPVDTKGSTLHQVPINDGFLLTLGAADVETLKAEVGRLTKQCDDADPHVRRKAIVALSEIKHPTGVDILLDRLQRAPVDDPPETAERVLAALEKHVDDKRVAEALIRLLNDPTRAGRNGGGRLDACRLLAGCDHPKVADTLLHLASTERDSMQIQAIWGLRKVEKGRAVQVLHELLEKTQPTELARGPIATVLCEHGEPLDREWVMELIRGWPGQHHTYSNAVTVIAQHGDLDDAKALAGCLRDDDNPEVSSFNARLIEAIKQLGGPKEAYRWLDANRIQTDALRKRNQEAMAAYRRWAASEKNEQSE